MSQRSSCDAVLLVTHSADHFTVDRVADAIERRGKRPFRLDTDLFPEEVRLSARLGAGMPEHLVETTSGVLSASDVCAVWARKVWFPRLSENVDEQFRAACLSESLAALEGFFDGLSAARWINEPSRERAAENKLLQLRVAREAGLSVPETLVTNDAAHARDFFDECEGAVVAKLLRPLSVGMDGSDFFVYTSNVTRADIEDAGALRHCPMVFQRRVEKASELRVAYVAGRFFVGELDAAESSHGRTDWRRADPEECTWSRGEVPADVAASIDELMRRLGLSYGAIDLIRTPEGGHVFLEVNPGGEWGMLERDLGLPISEALADALLSGQL